MNLRIFGASYAVTVVATMVLASIYFKWWSMIDLSLLPFELPLLLATYVVVTFVSNFQVRSRWMLVFPVYALVQGMVMPLLGAVNYMVLARRRKRLGRYRFRYRRGTPAGVLEQITLERTARVTS